MKIKKLASKCIAVTYLFIVFFLTSCSKKVVLNCDSSEVQDSLLNISKQQISTLPMYFQQKLSDFVIVNKPDNNLLTCKATLTYISNFDNTDEKKFEILYNIQADKKAKVNVILLDDINDFRKKQQSWLNKIAKQIENIRDYQNTPFGALYTIEKNNEQTLYFNNRIVIPQISNYKVSIEDVFNLNDDSYVFLIGNYTQTTLDADSANNVLIRIESSGITNVSVPFAYQQNGISESNGRLIIKGKSINRPYAEDSDFPIYSYESRGLVIIQNVKPDSYYRVKFSKMRPIDIITQAKSDNCFDNLHKLINMTNICHYGIKYCFEFNSIINPIHDEYYEILDRSCKR